MTLELALRRSLLDFAQFGYGKSRLPKTKGYAHVLGRGTEDVSGGQTPDGQDSKPPSQGGKYDKRGSRLLETISLGEVQDAYALYEKQLIPTNDGALVKKNNFYTFWLQQNPTVMFGRVKVCVPTDGHIQDAEKLELAFPLVDAKPEAVILHPGDVDLQKKVQSYRLQVRIFGTDEDRADIAWRENKFAEAGFALDFRDNIVELIDSPEMDDETLPWFNVIGSSLFARLSPDLKNEVRSSLWNLSPRGTLLINYHPGNTPPHVKKLNDELDYVYRFSEFYLSDPKTPEQMLSIVRTTFHKVFNDPSNRSKYLSNWQDRIK